MSKKIIFIFIVAVSLFFATMEFLLNQPKSKEIKNEQQNSNINNNQNFDIENNVDIPDPIFTSFINKESFEKSDFKEVQMVKVERINTFFNFINITPEEDDFSVITATFSQDGEIIAKLYEFQPETEITTAKIFSTLFAKLRNNIPETQAEDISLNQTNTFGDHSFYFNNKQYDEMVFLVVKSSDKILGFEYKKIDHEKMKPVIEFYFPKNEGWLYLKF